MEDRGYPGIVTYGRHLGLVPWHIQEQCDQAAAEGAPRDAVRANRGACGHQPEDGWLTIAGVTDARALAAVTPGCPNCASGRARYRGVNACGDPAWACPDCTADDRHPFTFAQARDGRWYFGATGTAPPVSVPTGEAQ